MFQASPLEEKRGTSFISLQVSLASSTHSLTLSWAVQCLHRWFTKRKNLKTKEVVKSIPTADPVVITDKAEDSYFTNPVGDLSFSKQNKNTRD